MVVFAYPSTVIREAEGPLIDAGVPLMARAAQALARFCADEIRTARGQVAGARVCVLAGPGNNAGDALFAGAALSRRGAKITVVTLFEGTHIDGLAAAQRAGADVIAYPAARSAGDTRGDILRELTRADLVLDGILGTGGRRGLPPHIASLIKDWTPRDGSILIAVDVPSDLSPAEPGADDRLHADHTVTFGGLKAELIDPRVSRFTGEVHVVDIGLHPAQSAAAGEVLDSEDLIAEFPRPDAQGYKYSRGVVGVLAGSEEYPGAGVLTTTSAVNCGIGMVRYLGSPLVAEFVLGLHAEVVTAPGRMNALVMGPGDPEDEFVRDAVDALTDTSIPVVLDAGALEMVGRADSVRGTWLAKRPVVLTPHAGELARLLSRILGEIITSSRITADPIGWAKRAAKLSGCIVLLKGHQTVIACPDGFCVLPEAGPASLATAGSGDVLAGIIGAMLAVFHATRQQASAESQQTSPEAPLPDRDWAHIVGLAVLIHNAAGYRAVNAGTLVDAVVEVAGDLIHSRSLGGG